MRDGVTVIATLSACGEDEVVTDIVAAPKPVVEVDTSTWTYKRKCIDGTRMHRVNEALILVMLTVCQTQQ